MEIGEHLVGAYLELIERCDIVHYGKRLERQVELDVLGLRFDGTLFLCEAATHIDGLNYLPGDV